MESRSEHSPPERQTWNTTYFAPGASAKPAQTETTARDSTIAPDAVNMELCARVREQLQAVLENDGTVPPAAATALYGHLAICADCAREFQAMQQVVHMLEALPLAELPADYSRLVMRRIQAGDAAHRDVSTGQSAGLCDRVREKLQPLLDNDLSIRPEMATALYGHMAICPDCASEFAAQRQLVNMLETLPPVELPIDYSARVMARIQAGGYSVAPAKEQAAPGPTSAASSLASEEVAARDLRPAETRTAERLAETGVSFWQRLIGSVALSGLFIYLLASDWGRQMLGVSADAARIWLSQVGEHLSQVPVLGALIVSLSSTLASAGDALSHTFSALGGVAAQTLALEVSLGLAALLLLSSRRRFTLSGL